MGVCGFYDFNDKDVFFFYFECYKFVLYLNVVVMMQDFIICFFFLVVIVFCCNWGKEFNLI